MYVIFLLCLTVGPASGNTEPLSFAYQYNLADFSGTIPYLHAILAKDSVRREVYVMTNGKNDVRIFGETGMEIYRFGDEGEFAGAVDLAVDERGDIYFLYPYGNASITRCNYRGEPQDQFTIQGIPEEYAGTSPRFMEIVKEKIYLADPMRLVIIVADIDGNFEQGYNAKEMIQALEESDMASRKRVKREDTPGRHDETTDDDITGFNVDGRGNIYFTIATKFAAFRISPDGILESWGKAGSVPGSFGVASGIAADDMGHIYVTDKLRSVVLVFDSTFNFITEFGFRGLKPENLIVPNEIVVGRDGRIFVSQAAKRGVSVFSAYGRSN